MSNPTITIEFIDLYEQVITLDGYDKVKYKRSIDGPDVKIEMIYPTDIDLQNTYVQRLMNKVHCMLHDFDCLTAEVGPDNLFMWEDVEEENIGALEHHGFD